MSSQQTRNQGATRAGDGRFLFDLGKLERIKVGGAYSPPKARWSKASACRSASSPSPAAQPPAAFASERAMDLRPQGKARVSVAGQPVTLASPGMLIYAPANAVHSVEVLPEEDLVFFTVKDSRTASSARARPEAAGAAPASSGGTP